MKTLTHVVAVVVALGVCPAIRADHHHKVVDLPGVWKAVASTDESAREITWTFQKEGDKLVGVSVDRESGDERKLDRVVVKEKKVTLEIDMERDGNEGVIKVEMEEETQGRLVGKWSIVGDNGTEYMSGDVSAVKEIAFAGQWDTISTLANGTTWESAMLLKGENSALKGSFRSARGEAEVDKVSVTEKGLRLEFDLEMNGNSINCVIKTEARGNDKLVGKWVVMGEDGSEAAEGEWSAVRKPADLAGTWDVVAIVPGNADYTGTLTLTSEEGKYAGTSQGSDSDATTLKTISVEGQKLEFSVPFEQDGNTGTIAVVAEQKEDGRLEGEWFLTGSDGNEYARAAWTATRK